MDKLRTLHVALTCADYIGGRGTDVSSWMRCSSNWCAFIFCPRSTVISCSRTWGCGLNVDKEKGPPKRGLPKRPATSLPKRVVQKNSLPFPDDAFYRARRSFQIQHPLIPDLNDPQTYYASVARWHARCFHWLSQAGGKIQRPTAHECLTCGPISPNRSKLLNVGERSSKRSGAKEFFGHGAHQRPCRRGIRQRSHRGSPDPAH